MDYTEQSTVWRCRPTLIRGDEEAGARCVAGSVLIDRSQSTVDEFVDGTRDERLIRDPFLDRSCLYLLEIPGRYSNIDPLVFSERMARGLLETAFFLAEIPHTLELPAPKVAKYLKFLSVKLRFYTCHYR
jgi:hypothetical protein